MATRISKSDIDRVLSLVDERLPNEDLVRTRARLITTRDEIEVFVSGWDFAQGWSRGFTVRTPHDYFSAQHDAGRYCGTGWHDRMAADILEQIRSLRNRLILSCELCRVFTWLDKDSPPAELHAFALRHMDHQGDDYAIVIFSQVHGMHKIYTLEKTPDDDARPSRDRKEPE